MTISPERPTRLVRQQLDAVAREAQKLAKLLLVQEAHALRERGCSTRESADLLGISKSAANRALQVDPSKVAAQIDARVLDAAAAFLDVARPLPDVELPTTDQRPPAGDVVVFDIMRESLTTVLGDYMVLIQRAQDAGDGQEGDQLMKTYVELETEVDGVNPRDRDEQTAMTRRLRDLHADLQTAIHSQ